MGSPLHASGLLLQVLHRLHDDVHVRPDDDLEATRSPRTHAFGRVFFDHGAKACLGNDPSICPCRPNEFTAIRIVRPALPNPLRPRLRHAHACAATAGTTARRSRFAADLQWSRASSLQGDDNNRVTRGSSARAATQSSIIAPQSPVESCAILSAPPQQT